MKAIAFIYSRIALLNADVSERLVVMGVFFLIIVFVAILAILIFSGLLRRRQRVAIIEFMEMRGGKVRSIEAELHNEAKRIVRNRWSIEYEDADGEVWKGLVQVSHHDVAFLMNDPIDIWLAREHALRSPAPLADVDQDGVFMNLDRLMNAARKEAYRQGAAYECLAGIFRQFAQGKRDSVVLQEDGLQCLVDGIHEEEVRFAAVLQQLRLFHEEEAHHEGMLELMVEGNTVDLDWRCDRQKPARTLVLTKRV